MAIVRRVTSKDAIWARAWTADAVADLATVTGTHFSNAKHGDVAFVTATGLYYTFRDNGTWEPNPLRQVTVTLTDAQIKALSTTPFTLVPSPGVGVTIAWFAHSLRSDFTAGAYTNIDPAAYLGAQYTGGNDASNYLFNDVGLGATQIDAVFGVAFNRRVLLQPYTAAYETDGWGNAPLVQDWNDNEGLALRLHNGAAGDLTGGNSANTLTVTTTYIVEPV